MILQSLVEYYENLVANDTNGSIPRRGWGIAKVSYALQLDEDGNVVYVLPLQQEEGVFVKSANHIVPEHQERTRNICPHFLCDNSSYLLGFDRKGNKTFDKLIKSAEYHCQLLAKCELSVAIVIKKYFEKIINYDKNLKEHPYIGVYYHELREADNIVFRYNGNFVHNMSEIKKLWERHFVQQNLTNQGFCLVSGKTSAIAITHPLIQGVFKANTSGAKLVSFNFPSCTSYGKTEKHQGKNAPISEYVTFCYGEALRHLLFSKHKRIIGDTTIVCWANQNTEGCNFITSLLFGEDETFLTDEDTNSILDCIAMNRSIDFKTTNMSYTNNFYLLGMKPHMSRLAICMFYQNSFGSILKNIEAHFHRLYMVHNNLYHCKYITLQRMLWETINKQSKEKPQSSLSNALMYSILFNSKYPVSLLQKIMLRIRAEREINGVKASIIKAYLLKNYENIYKGVIRVEVNIETTNVPFVLGRLFAILEHAQKDVCGGIKVTIRDQFFNAAAATPALIFPIILKQYNYYLVKMEISHKIYHEKLISDCIDKLLLNHGNQHLPKTMSLEQQSVFMLGYYQQKQNFFKKHEGNENRE